MLRETLSSIYGDLLFANGFDEAIVGIVERCGFQPVVCYDRARGIKILVERDGMTYEEAEEYFSYNVIGAYMGPLTPMWLTGVNAFNYSSDPSYDIMKDLGKRD